MKATNEDIELEVLKRYLLNDGFVLETSLVDPNKFEPTDIRYDGLNYQITLGDQEETERRRKVTSKGNIYTSNRDVTNIAELQLYQALKKKVRSSDENTILLIDCSSNGLRSWPDLDQEIRDWVKGNVQILGRWKNIYGVFDGKNIKVN